MTTRVPPSGRAWLERVWARIYFHLIEPFLTTHDPLPQVALGSAIGMFVGLTPTVGIQMYIVTMIWLFCRYVGRVRFNLTIAISLVWISNPVTTLPIYFLFLETGDWVLARLGYPVVAMSFEVFKAEVDALSNGASTNIVEWLFHATQVLLVEFGWPIVVGSLVYAIPFTVLAYPLTYATMKRYRRYLARSSGLSYEDWRGRFEAKR